MKALLFEVVQTSFLQISPWNTDQPVEGKKALRRCNFVSAVLRKECPAAGVAALVYPILWVKQPALIVGGPMGDD